MVDAQEELSRALAEREAQKGVTAGAGQDPNAQPRMNIQVGFMRAIWSFYDLVLMYHRWVNRERKWAIVLVHAIN